MYFLLHKLSLALHSKGLCPLPDHQELTQIAFEVLSNTKQHFLPKASRQTSAVVQLLLDVPTVYEGYFRNIHFSSRDTFFQNLLPSGFEAKFNIYQLTSWAWLVSVKSCGQTLVLKFRTPRCLRSRATVALETPTTADKLQ